MDAEQPSREKHIYTWTNRGQFIVSVVAQSLEQARHIVAKHRIAGEWWLKNHPPRIRATDSVGIIAIGPRQTTRWAVADDGTIVPVESD